MFEAKDRLSEGRPFRGQGKESSWLRPRTNAQVFSQKKVFSQIFREISGEERKGHDHGPFSTNQKIVLSSTEDRAFSRTCKLRGQGFQHMSSKLKTSSRTPSLTTTTFKLRNGSSCENVGLYLIFVHHKNTVVRNCAV